MLLPTEELMAPPINGPKPGMSLRRLASVIPMAVVRTPVMLAARNATDVPLGDIP